ncbi:fungal specific transcription factor factor domain protein [Fusarium beomiforme]|uniref:Fungal specific transcription factor factor domain protein n=1 Tax=Fusarium beomiforme TaxID=44412 RepID=A0A9P5DYL7_9HYPO|nr:fungal specific transcription factor factor domain protein [Fusarium beomiforme]
MSRTTLVQHTPQPQVELKFVTGDQPDLLKANSSIRSHIAKQGWKPYTKPGRPKRRGREKKQEVVFECIRQEWRHLPPIERELGGGRVDPFRTYPGPWNPQIPGLVDHYLVHMAVDIPELDQPGNKGLLRTSWFPLAISFWYITFGKLYPTTQAPGNLGNQQCILGHE